MTAQRGGDGSFGTKQQSFRREIVFHGVVKIQVVPREVCKNSGMKRDTVHPSQRECMGGNFHCGMSAAGLLQFFQQSIKIE